MTDRSIRRLEDSVTTTFSYAKALRKIDELGPKLRKKRRDNNAGEKSPLPLDRQPREIPLRKLRVTRTIKWYGGGRPPAYGGLPLLDTSTLHAA